MHSADKEKIEGLIEIFNQNYAITRLYSSLLEVCPTVIKPEYVQELCRDGLDREGALVALLSEIFGIDMERSLSDRILVREYLYKSVRVLNPKRYTENKYYRNIKIPSIKDGNWELKWETYPAYRAFIADDMILKDNFREIPPLGFFPEEFRFPAVLEDGNEWMTLTPVDLDTSEEAIEKSRGRVLTLGLGLGYFTYMASEKDEVESVTVVELSEDVIRLFKKHILPQFPNRDKVRIIHADAIKFVEEGMQGEKYDFVFADTWRDSSDGEPMWERIKRCEKSYPDTEFSYWIENHIISRKRALMYEELRDRLDRGETISYREAVKMLTEFGF